MSISAACLPLPEDISPRAFEHQGFVCTPPDLDEDRVAHAERRLWRAVIARALRDAAGRAEHSTGDPRRRQQEALSWLLESPTDFRMVCDLAGLGALSVHLAGSHAVARVLVARAARRHALLERLTRPIRPHENTWPTMD